ncbi:MAG: MFS transporter [Thermodesulfovibrionales bacterium]|nr:MFS transporter [Thermodesulfovibrionales bacterium]
MSSLQFDEFIVKFTMFLIDSFIKLGFHYGWIIVLSGVLGIFACLGLGRFALGMLLPSVGEALNLSYTQMGLISTGNFIGYLFAVLIAGILIKHLGTRRLIFYALLIVGITLILSSLANEFRYLLFVYTLTGFGSGVSNIPIMALISSWFVSRLRGLAAGIIVSGSGFAILMTGTLLPIINRVSEPAEGWRISWLILGVTVIFIAFICLLLIRDKPEDIGFKQAGAAERQDFKLAKEDYGEKSIYKKGIIYYLGIIYFFFGYTYVIYTTFAVTVLIVERGFSEQLAGWLWAIIGFLSIFSGPLFGSFSDKYGRKAGLIAVFSFQLIAYLFIAMKLPIIFLYLSIGLFGIVAFSIPAIMAATVYEYVKPKLAASAFGFVTFIFGIGQIIGPAVAGSLADFTGSFSSSFFMASACNGIAILLCSRLKKSQNL